MGNKCVSEITQMSLTSFTSNPLPGTNLNFASKVFFSIVCITLDNIYKSSRSLMLLTSCKLAPFSASYTSKHYFQLNILRVDIFGVSYVHSLMSYEGFMCNNICIR